MTSERSAEHCTAAGGGTRNAVAEAALELASRWKQFAAHGDAQDECADELGRVIAAALASTPATEATAGSAHPSPTALAAKAFMERIDNTTYRRIIENRALNGGWVGSRAAAAWDTHVSDSIAKAALDAVLDLFRMWAAECGEFPAP